MTTQAYLESSSLLLAQAEAELAIGDVRQASEKGWGATAQIVKALAEERGWDHHSHGALYAAVDLICAETGNDDIYLLFQVANQLHKNFYENWDAPDNVRKALVAVRRFNRLVAPLLRSSG